jgi:hypothetical protein
MHGNTKVKFVFSKFCFGTSEDNIAYNFFARENNTFHFLSSDARSSTSGKVIMKTDLDYQGIGG